MAAPRELVSRPCHPSMCAGSFVAWEGQAKATAVTSAVWDRPAAALPPSSKEASHRVAYRPGCGSNYVE